MNPDKKLNLNPESTLATTLDDLINPLVSEDDTETDLAYVAEQVIQVLTDADPGDMNLDVPVDILIENILNLTDTLSSNGNFPAVLEILQPLSQLFPENEKVHTTFNRFIDFLNRHLELCWVPSRASDEVFFDVIALKRRLDSILPPPLTKGQIDSSVAEYSRIQEQRLLLIQKSRNSSDIAVQDGQYLIARNEFFNVLYLSGILDPRRHLPGIPDKQIHELEIRYGFIAEDDHLTAYLPAKARLMQLHYLIQKSDET